MGLHMHTHVLNAARQDAPQCWTMRAVIEGDIEQCFGLRIQATNHGGQSNSLRHEEVFEGAALSFVGVDACALNEIDEGQGALLETTALGVDARIELRQTFGVFFQLPP